MNPSPTSQLDCIGMKCPAPIVAVAKAAVGLRKHGGVLVVRADDPAFRPDIEAWARSTGAELDEITAQPGGVMRAVVFIDRDPGLAATPPEPETSPPPSSVVTLDLRGIACPGPVIALAKSCAQHEPGTQLQVIADDPGFEPDLHSWLSSGRAELVTLEQRGADVHALLRILESAGRTVRPGTTRPPAAPSAAPLATALAAQASPAPAPAASHNRCTLLVLHNDHEALLAALLVANGAAAQGMETSLFFTFWGLNLLRGDHSDPTKIREKVGWRQKLMKWLMPKGPEHQRLGQMHFGGIGKRMLSSIMRRENILGLPELMRSSQELGVKFTACTMSMTVMGITKADIYPYPNLEYAGVATFVDRSQTSSVNLVF